MKKGEKHINLLNRIFDEINNGNNNINNPKYQINKRF